jgi:polar amino acid transport system substrate-binding protein
MRITVHTLLYIVLLISPLEGASAASKSSALPALVLSTFAGPPLSNESRTGYYDLILKEAFRRAGLVIDIVRLPAERSLTNADQGVTDGDFVRIAGLGSIYPNLVQVDEKITDFEFVGFSRNRSIKLSGWKSLEPYDVAIVRGWKILEISIVGARSLVRVKDQKLLFTLLKNDRADVVVYSRFEGYEMIRQLDIRDAVSLEPPLAIREMFLYLNRKHSDLVPVIEKKLREMKLDGSIDLIRSKTLVRF